VIPSERHPRGGCVGTGPDIDGIAALNTKRLTVHGPDDPHRLPTVGKVWTDRPDLPSHLQGVYVTFRHSGTRVGIWFPLRDSMRLKEAQAGTAYVNALGYYRRGAVALCAPDGTVLAAAFCTPTTRCEP
jgi:hypothetical protein